ncbi:MAG: WecB/TagA/CpsF family glycosyltransferase [Candidatus Latescibacterota bacterium]
MTRRVYIAGCPVDCIGLEELCNTLHNAMNFPGSRAHVLGVNAAFVVDANKNPEYRDVLDSTSYVPADGYWVAAALKLLGVPQAKHVGIERLTYLLLSRMGQANGSVYLVGARQEVVERAAHEIEHRFPGVRVAGYRNGYFKEHADKEIVKEINGCSPQLVLVGMTSPLKEYWMARNKHALNVPVVIGVGGLFDVLSGAVPSAPDWMKDHGLEWFFRFMHDPKRLWKRYTTSNTRFIWLVGLQRVQSQFGGYVPYKEV